MAPRKDENDGGDMKSESPAPCSPNSYAIDIMCEVKRASLSFDSLDLTKCTDTENSNTALRHSLLHLSLRHSELSDEVDASIRALLAFSATLEACRQSLRSEARFLIHEAKVLLDNLGKEGNMITSWRASLAQIRLDSYLATVESAMHHQSRARLDKELLSVADSISLKSNDEITMEWPTVIISSWKSPSLVFNVVVGPQINYDHQLSQAQLPLNLKISAIAEVLDNSAGSSTFGSYQACIVGVEKCAHESRSFCVAGTVFVGDCSVTVTISPRGSKEARKKTWGIDKDCRFLNVKQARIVQVNAFPPKPKAAVDLYTACTYGDRDTTITLHFSTSMTLHINEVPEVHIELVMGFCGGR